MTESEALGPVLSIGQEADAVRYGASSGIQRGGARERAKASLTAAPAASVEAITDGGDGVASVQARAQGFADSLAAKWQAKVGDAPPLAHARPWSLVQARERIHRDAGHYESGFMKGFRLTYGYVLFLPLMLAFYAVLWIVFTPPGALIGSAAGFVLWTWS